MNRLAVIGAGASGLCALRHLISSPAVCRAVAFEKSGSVGGTWVYTPECGKDRRGDPIHSSMYKNLRTNLPKEAMAFPDFSFKKGLPSYIHHSYVKEYLESYSNHFGLRKHIKLQTRVQLVERCPMEDGNSKWQVTYKHLDGKENTEEFDAVIVCNGHYSIPLIPKTPGSDVFEGLLVHSHNYRVPEVFQGQHVVCLGAGASGMDISLDLAKHAKQVYLSHNKPPLQTPLYVNVMQKEEIKTLTKNTVIFNNDEEVKADAIIFCTGYHYTFPFLSESCDLTIDDERVYPLYKHLIHTMHPTLSFIGIPKTVCPFPMFDCQIRLVVSVLEGKFKLPSQEEMEADTEADYQQRLKEGLPKRHAHLMGPRQWAYNDDLASLANLNPIPIHVRSLFDLVHKTRIKDLLGYKNINYELKKNSFEQIPAGEI